MALLIDDMQKEDISGVCMLEEECFSQPWSYNAFLSEYENENAVTLVAIEDMEIIGFVNAHFLLDNMDINNIAVTYKKRQQNVASMLLDELIKRAKQKKIDTITLEVRQSNQAAINLYEKFGFKKVGHRKDFYQSPKEDAFIMTANVNER